MNTQIIKNLASSLPRNGRLMPVLFIGHGSPMNGIEDNEFSRTWTDMGTQIPEPRAVIVVSAHWYTNGTRVTAMNNPETIHDFGGFPQALFDAEYPAPGNAALAAEVKDMLAPAYVELDHDWGLDHGAWTILRHMYPKAEIPVLQVSIDYTRDPQYHYNLAKQLQDLRYRGILIIGSGNMVHNLRMLDWQQIHGGGFDWALEMNETFKRLILNNDIHALLNYQDLGTAARLAIPTAEHYLPLIYTLGQINGKDDIRFFNDKAVGGSLTMTSVLISGS